MKLVLLIILLCGTTSAPVPTTKLVKAKKTCTSRPKAATAKTATANLDIIPAGLLFQF